MTKRLNAMFKRFGSKMRMAPKYPEPKFDSIVEPFAGSACYSLLYHDSPMVTLAETDPGLVVLWEYLTDIRNIDEVAGLPTTSLVVGQDIRELDLSAGAKELIRHTQRVGRSDCWTVSKWANANSGLWSDAWKARVVRQMPYIQHWGIVPYGIYAGSSQGTEERWFIPKFMRQGGNTIFIDPPYANYPKVYANSAPIDYNDLGEWCQELARCGNQVIVCEMESDYSSWLPFEPLCDNMAGRTSMMSTRKVYKELVWLG